MQCCFKCTLITIATARSFPQSYRFCLDGETCRVDYHGEVAKLSELVWFRILAKQPKLAEQWIEAHWVGKSERSDEHLLAIRGSTYSARAIRRKPRDEQWNLESVTAALVSPWELRERAEFDAPLTRQKYITNQMLDQHGRTPLLTRSLGTRPHSSDRRARSESIWTKELAEAEVPIRAEAEVANLSVKEVPIDPHVRARRARGCSRWSACCDGCEHRSSCCKSRRGSAPARRESSTTHGGVAGTTGAP